MKNQKEKTLLSILSRECKPNQFSVVEKKDILFSFPKIMPIEEEELDGLVLSLERQGFVKIKYEDDSVYCVALLKKEEEKREVSPSFKSLFFLALLGGMIGGFAGSFLSFLIFNL